MSTNAEQIDKAVRFDFTTWGKPKAAELDNLTIDHDFTSDIRNLLIEYPYDKTFNLREFLENCESTRYIDLARAYEVISSLGRDELSKLAMDYSLCPMHFVDWAICFDDEDPGCNQIRQVFPHGHDT